jgi:hypothetical protein
MSENAKILKAPTSKLGIRQWYDRERREHCTAEKCTLTVEQVFRCTQTRVAPADYFSSVYMTLLSVFQGVVVAGLFSGFFERCLKDGCTWYVELPKFLPVAFLLVLVWHKYVNHHQFLGWQLFWHDTLIVAGFGFLECLLVYLAVKIDVFLVCVLVAFCFLMGGVAYRHAASSYGEDDAKEVYSHHYRCPGKQCDMGWAIRRSMQDFEFVSWVASLLLTGFFTAAAWSLAAVCGNDGTIPLVAEWVFALSAIAMMVLFLWGLDLKRILRKPPNSWGGFIRAMISLGELLSGEYRKRKFAGGDEAVGRAA